MRTLECADPRQRARAIVTAADCIAREELIVVPTESGYAVATDAFSEAATLHLKRVRDIAATTKLQVLVASARMLQGIAQSVSGEALHVIQGFWPGPLTVIVSRTPTVSMWTGGDAETLLARMPLVPATLELLSRTGPLVCSLLRDDENNVVLSSSQLGPGENDFAAFLDAGPIEPSASSTVLDCVGDRFEVLRPGPISAADIEEARRERSEPDVDELGEVGAVPSGD